MENIKIDEVRQGAPGQRRRLRRYAWDPQRLCDSLMPGLRSYEIDENEGIPKDGMVVCAGFDDERNVLFVVVESASFEEINVGEVIPQGSVTLRRVFGESK